jgi:isoquinoline 1-oxidoreductase beta subunit
MSGIGELGRREFVKAGIAAGAGLTLAVRFLEAGPAATSAESFTPNAFLEIEPSGDVQLWVAKSEMGQGVLTALAMLIAEELEVDWARVRVTQAPADTKFGDQLTGSSGSVRNGWDPLRRAGAAAREMLVAAAAQAWSVPPESCRAERGEVVHRESGRRLGYDALTAAARRLEVPSGVRLKEPEERKLVGTRVPRVDTPEKTDGRAVFGIDVQLPGLLLAAVERCPVFGGTLAGVDDAQARRRPGVRAVVPFERGVGVVADSYWTALAARRELKIRWNEGPHAGLSSASIARQLESLADGPGLAPRRRGDAAAALASAARTLEARYEFPFLAHATLEPMNCTAHVRPGGCEIWAPTQHPQLLQQMAARLLGLAPADVRVHVTLLGGGFGRRAMPDFALEAVQLSKAAGAPVKVVWTREDDFQHDFYRPASHHHLRAALDERGHLVGWTHRVAAPSILAYNFPELFRGEDGQLTEGADVLYGVPNVELDHAVAPAAVPVGWWRSVFHSQNAFVNECFLDEIARATAQDPLALRRSLLEPAPRLKHVLELAAERAGWGAPLPKGSSRGLASHASFGSFVAQVAEVSAEARGWRVRRVVCAVDCGTVVNPDIVEAQMEGAIVFGLSAALRNEITIEGGRAVQSNFNRYPLLRIDEMPEVEVHIVPSLERPGGVGEPGTPPIAPAVANAIFAATGRPLRRLPLSA